MTAPHQTLTTQPISMMLARASSSGGGGFSAAAGWLAFASLEPEEPAAVSAEPAASTAAKSKASMNIDLFSFLFADINKETWLCLKRRGYDKFRLPRSTGMSLIARP